MGQELSPHYNLPLELVNIFGLQVATLEQVKSDYMLQNPTETELIEALVDFCLRGKKIKPPAPMSQFEWVTFCLFYLAGWSIEKISLQTKKSEGQILSYFFKGKEKFLSIEGQYEL